MKYVKYIVNIVIALLLVLYISYSRGLFSAANAADQIKAASDGFTITAFLYLTLGGLSWVASTGFFDIFSYGFKKGAHAIIPGMVRDEAGKYLDYKTEMEEKRAGRKTHWFTLAVGLVLILAGAILSALWYKY